MKHEAAKKHVEMLQMKDDVKAMEEKSEKMEKKAKVAQEKMKEIEKG